MIKEFKAAISVITGSLKWRLQSLSIGINKISLKKLRSKYADYWIDKNNIKVSRAQS